MTALVYLTSLALVGPTLVVNKPDAPKVDLKKMKTTIDRLEKPITLDFTGVRLPDVLQFIEQSSSTKIGWDQAPPERPFTINVERQPLAAALQTLLDQCGWTYALRTNGEIVLLPASEPKKE